MILYNSLPDFNGNYSTSFLNLNADLTANIAVELVTKINPEYVIISWKKDNGIFRYIYYTYEFITTINKYRELTLEKLLNLHESISGLKKMGILVHSEENIYLMPQLLLPTL